MSKELERLEKFTGQNRMVCFDALQKTTSFEAAVEMLTPDTFLLKRGMIVIVKNPIMSPFKTGYITKILGIVRRKKKLTFESTFRNDHLIRLNNIVILEDMSCQCLTGIKYLNKPVFFENICSLVRATEEEKQIYRKSK
jgi:hypothetical protein